MDPMANSCPNTQDSTPEPSITSSQHTLVPRPPGVFNPFAGLAGTNSATRKSSLSNDELDRAPSPCENKDTGAPRTYASEWTDLVHDDERRLAFYLDNIPASDRKQLPKTGLCYDDPNSSSYYGSSKGEPPDSHTCEDPDRDPDQGPGIQPILPTSPDPETLTQTPSFGELLESIPPSPIGPSSTVDEWGFIYSHRAPRQDSLINDAQANLSTLDISGLASTTDTLIDTAPRSPTDSSPDAEHFPKIDRSRSCSSFLGFHLSQIQPAHPEVTPYCANPVNFSRPYLPPNYDPVLEFVRPRHTFSTDSGYRKRDRTPRVYRNTPLRISSSPDSPPTAEPPKEEPPKEEPPKEEPPKKKPQRRFNCGIGDFKALCLWVWDLGQSFRY